MKQPRMRRDEKVLLKPLVYLEEKLASLGEPQNATQKRLKTLWKHKLSHTKRMLLAVRDGKEARFWVDYPAEPESQVGFELAAELLVEDILKQGSPRQKETFSTP